MNLIGGKALVGHAEEDGIGVAAIAEVFSALVFVKGEGIQIGENLKPDKIDAIADSDFL